MLGVGAGFGPLLAGAVAESQASAEVGPYSSANYWSAATAPDLAANSAFVVLFELTGTPAAAETVWASCGATNGWHISISTARVVSLTLVGGITYPIGTISSDGMCCVAIMRTGAGAVWSAFNGADAVNLVDPPAYVVNDGTSSQTLGRKPAALGTDGASDVKVLEVAQLSASLTTAELKSASGALNTLNRYQLTQAVRVHASLVSNLQFLRDWDGSAATAVAGTGSTPQTWTRNGSLTKTALESERYYPVQQYWFHNSASWTARNGYFLRNAFAKLKVTTNSSSRIVVDFVSGLTNASGFYEIGLVKDGVYALNPLEISITQTVRASDVLLSGAAEKVIELYDGAQSNPSASIESAGAMVAIRIPKSADFAIVPPTAPAKRLVIYGDGSACGFGVGSSPNLEGWASRVEREYPGGVTIEAYAERALKDDCTDSTARTAFVAHVVAMCDGTSENRLVLAIGHKDYARNLWTAASFGAAYAALLDDLHTALPSLMIFCVTPTSATTETANGLGSTLGNYRTQISTAQSTRSGYCTLVDGTTILSSGNLDGTSGVYPNSTGHIEVYGYARKLVKWIPKNELDYSTLSTGTKADIDSRYVVPAGGSVATAHSVAPGLEGTYDFTQASATARPAFGSSGWDATKRIASWTHDGGNDTLLNQGGLAGQILSGDDIAGWMTWVARVIVVTGAQKVMVGLGKSNAANPSANVYSLNTDGKWYVNKRDDAGTLLSAASVASCDTSKHRFLVQWKTNGNADLYVDEVLVISDGNINVTAATLDTVCVGAFYANGSASVFSNMEMVRLTCGAGTLTSGDRSLIAADQIARYF